MWMPVFITGAHIRLIILSTPLLFRASNSPHSTIVAKRWVVSFLHSKQCLRMVPSLFNLKYGYALPHTSTIKNKSYPRTLRLGSKHFSSKVFIFSLPLSSLKSPSRHYGPIVSTFWSFGFEYSFQDKH